MRCTESEGRMLDELAVLISNYVPNAMQKKFARRVCILLEKHGIDTEAPVHSELFRMSGFPCTCEAKNEQSRNCFL